MDKLHDMQVFSAVVRAGSFVGAARRLNLSTTKVSRQVGDLEKVLGARLLHRTTRQIKLTEAGRTYLNGCDRILSEIQDLDAKILAATAEPRGLLRIATLPGLPPLETAVLNYQRAFPLVDLEVVVLSRVVDMVEEQIDVWIHIFGAIPAGHIARPLNTVKLIVCASPDYLRRHGAPRHPQQLAAHRCFTTHLTRESNPWTFDRDDEHCSIRVGGGLISNDALLLRKMALAGEGIIRQPDYMVADDIQNGRLRTLLKGWHSVPVVQVSAVYPTARYVPAKVRAFLELVRSAWKEV